MLVDLSRSSRVRRLRVRLVLLAVSVALGLLTTAGCGSSSTTTTAPSPLVRCALTLSIGDQALPAGGGTAVIGVAATRDCTWTVAVEGPWISLRSPQNGQGDGTVEFAATSNPDPVVRRGALILNGQRAEITQAAAQCDISLADSSASFVPAGGSGRVDIRASSGLCTWSATSDSPWIQIRSGSEGRGSAQLLFDVSATTGPPRSGTLTIAGQRFSVTQSEGCTYLIAPTTHSAPPAGSNGTVVVTTTVACPWIAASNVPWIAVSPGIGSGPGPVVFTVAPSNGPSRTGTAVIAGHVFTVTQAQGCAYQVQPTSHNVGASGGSASVTVSSAPGCVWSASSEASWITIRGVSSGSGDGTITFSAAATTGAARNGTLTVAGQRVTVTQAQGCAYGVSPTQESIPAAGGTGRVTVTAGDGCTWSATSDVPWITIQSGSSGSANGTVNYTVAPTNGPGRTGTLTVAGQRVTVTQGQGCSYSINPTQDTVPASGGGGRVSVTAADGCGWNASSNAPWITITSGASGSGSGAVQYTAAATTGPGRSGTLTIAGHTFTLNQGQGCTYTIVPASATVPDAGGQTSFDVQSSAGCGWNANSQASWITISSGSSGSGNGTVQLNVAGNTGPSRTGTVTAADKTFTVTQGSGCSFSLSPTNQTVPPAGGNGSVTVTAPAGCGWAATSNAAWLSITGGASGSGTDQVTFAAAANSGPGRTGTLTIAGHTFTVTQGDACTFTIAPEQAAPGASAGSQTVTVTAPAGCTWAATSNASWISVTSGASGAGDGSVQLAVAANTGAARTGTATIAGRTFTVNQASGCSYTVNPETAAALPAGGSQRVDVTTDAACTWSATSNASWIGIASGASGTGNGNVDLSVAANTGPARTGTATVAGRTVTVNQESGCSYQLSATGVTIPSGGGTGSVNVTAGAGCPWTAVSRDPWIVVTAGASGSGNGTVEFTVEARSGGAARTGTILIAGVTFTVTQE